MLCPMKSMHAGRWLRMIIPQRACTSAWMEKEGLTSETNRVLQSIKLQLLIK